MDLLSMNLSKPCLILLTLSLQHSVATKPHYLLHKEVLLHVLNQSLVSLSKAQFYRKEM